jgi:predicted RNase H-like HicB family nuclease
MEPFRCRIVVEWSDDDREYVAEVPELGLRVRGTTIEHAVRQATSIGARSGLDKPHAAEA